MARKPSSSTLESRVREMFVQVAEELTAAVRQDFAEQVKRILGASAATAETPVGGARKRRGRGRKAVVPAARPAAAAPRKGAGRRAKGGRGKVSVGPAVESLFNVISANPGLRSEQIQKHLDLSPAQVKAGLAALRESGRVKTSGQARGTTYSAA